MSCGASGSIQQASENFGKDRRRFKSRARHLGQRRRTVVDCEVGRQLPVQRTGFHRDFGKAETKSNNSMERKKLARVRRALTSTPSVLRQLVENSAIFHDAVAQRDIELQHVAVATKTTVTQEVARIVG